MTRANLDERREEKQKGDGEHIDDSLCWNQSHVAPRARVDFEAMNKYISREGEWYEPITGRDALRWPLEGFPGMPRGLECLVFGARFHFSSLNGELERGMAETLVGFAKHGNVLQLNNSSPMPTTNSMAASEVMNGVIGQTTDKNKNKMTKEDDVG